MIVSVRFNEASEAILLDSIRRIAISRYNGNLSMAIKIALIEHVSRETTATPKGEEVSEWVQKNLI